MENPYQLLAVIEDARTTLADAASRIRVAICVDPSADIGVFVEEVLDAVRLVEGAVGREAPSG